MADPETWAYMLREHARTIRKQLALAERAARQGAEATRYSLTVLRNYDWLTLGMAHDVEYRQLMGA